MVSVISIHQWSLVGVACNPEVLSVCNIVSSEFYLATSLVGVACIPEALSVCNIVSSEFYLASFLITLAPSTYAQSMVSLYYASETCIADYNLSFVISMSDGSNAEYFLCQCGHQDKDNP
jgi:hypothetical protein